MNTTRSLVIRIVLAVVLIAAVAVLGLLITFKIADTQREDYFQQRKTQVATAAAAIDAADVATLTGTAADAETPQFQRIRSQLVRIRQSDPHIRFIYLMRPQDGKMVFLVDAEDPSSQDYSPPGQVYEEAKPRDFEVFDKKRPVQTEVEGPIQDRWGTWLSATSYITSRDGSAVALVGTDVDAERAITNFEQIKRLGVIFDMLALVLLVLVALQWILWRYHREKRLALKQQMEESVLKLNEELVRADRVKSDFIQLASHELRSPVNAVNIAVQTLDRSLEPKLDDDEKSLVQVAKNGANRLVDLVDNLLDITRMEAGDYVLKPKEVDLRELVDKTVGLYEPLAQRKTVGLTARLPDGPLDAVVDPQALLRILENLLSNAIKYTDFGGIVVALEIVGDKLRFSVKDTGMGIPERFQEEIFSKFAKFDLPVEQRRQGAGMGLAASKGMVEAQDGRIWFESEEGTGSTFCFEIPRYQVEDEGG
ncbi:MAG: HAMP domain-containing histidine kinase [Actinobacteria bacterium]|nr:HAMP domain-containing histidine kinase [Actinomycetota bacterium]MBU1943778.1 HAMP domain-containing histidine kinase [Actinomycetota bacterium]MBU2688243.1 HAMP domain-containing histidine kinase [Actinomycetota bacterium]